MIPICYPEIFQAFPDTPINNASSLFKITAKETLPSYFGVSELTSESFAAAGLMVARLLESQRSHHPVAVTKISVNQRLASLWLHRTIRPLGWELPPEWGDFTGDFLASDGWLRIHANADKHREAALKIIAEKGCKPYNKQALAEAVTLWKKEALVEAIVEAGGCAAVMHSMEEWQQHPQGSAVSKEPLIHWRGHPVTDGSCFSASDNPLRPLENIKVLDLTRILAGPIATRFLAAYGADVLRIDPPLWDEPATAPEVTPGKRCATLNLQLEEDRLVFRKKLQEADVIVHGYRPDALEKLGFGEAERRKLNPNVIDVCLNAYGWTGPWAQRRGFDSVVQMSCGIAAYGMQTSEKPFPLPAQALDHCTGYLMAAAVIHAIEQRQNKGIVYSARLSLARTASLLMSQKRQLSDASGITETEKDLSPVIEETRWGAVQRISFPLTIESDVKEVIAAWDTPASPLHSSAVVWR